MTRDAPAAYGKDTNLRLFRIALSSMQSAVADPQVIVIPGDFIAHDYQAKFGLATGDTTANGFDAFAEKTMGYVAFEFNHAFPRAQFVIALGNNDSLCGDYCVSENDTFHAASAKAGEELVNRGGRAPSFMHDFAAYGDYTATLPDGTHIVAVNSNAWSPTLNKNCDSGNEGQRATLEWLEGTVKKIPQGSRTIVVLHIPPGIDPHETQKRGTPLGFYCSEPLARLRNVRAADGQPAGLIIAGHLHNDGFRIVDKTPMLLVPLPISPKPPEQSVIYCCTGRAGGRSSTYSVSNFLTMVPGHRLRHSAQSTTLTKRITSRGSPCRRFVRSLTN